MGTIQTHISGVVIVVSHIVGVVGIVSVLEVRVIISVVVVIVVLSAFSILADVIIVVPVRAGLAEGIGHRAGLAGLAGVEWGSEGDLGSEILTIDLVSILDVLLLAVAIVVADGAGVVGVEMELKLGRGEGFTFHAADLGIELLVGVGCFLKEDAVKISCVTRTALVYKEQNKKGSISVMIQCLSHCIHVILSACATYSLKSRPFNIAW